MNATPIHAPPRLSPGQQAADQHQPGRRLRIHLLAVSPGSGATSAEAT